MTKTLLLLCTLALTGAAGCGTGSGEEISKQAEGSPAGASREGVVADARTAAASENASAALAGARILENAGQTEAALSLNRAAARVESTARVVATPASITASGPKQIFTVKLVGKAFDKVTEGGGIDLRFDPAIVRVTAVSVNRDTWEFFDQGGVIDNVNGRVDGIQFASFAGRRGDFPIVSVTFESLAAGTSVARLAESALTPFASGGQRLAVTFQ